MRSRIVLAALALLLFGGVLPARAAAPIGAFDGKPKAGGNASWGLMPVVGWALADNGVASVDILVDGGVVVRAVYGVRRPDVTRRFASHPYPDLAAPGYVAYVDTTHFNNGFHTVSALVTSRTGEQVALGPVRTYVFRNALSMLGPFGEITFPARDAEMRGRCSDLTGTRRWSIITGNALDAGAGENDEDVGVAWLELLVDGSTLNSVVPVPVTPQNPTGFAGITYNTRLACTFMSAPLNNLENCYGLQSPSETYIYPSLFNSDRAKYRFAVDVGTLINLGLYDQGHHTITIRGGDFGDNVRSIATINVFFSCDDDIPNEASIGDLESPNLSQPWHQTITVSGWALDFEGIHTIDIRVNGVVVGQATLNGPRPDVAELYPGYPSSQSAGYTFQLDTTQYNDGPVTVEVVVNDVLGAATLIGERDAVIDNHDGQ